MAGEDPARIARIHLRAAVGAAKRLAAGKDEPDTLHDFRVALRRLRSVLRAYPTALHRVRHAHRRRLKRLARATNAARDADVQLGLLCDFHSSTAVTTLRAAIEHDRRRASKILCATTAPALLALAPRLRAALRQSPVAGNTALRLRVDTGARALELVERLAGQLAALSRPDDHAAVHAARITGKRLRYLLEPWAEAERGAALAVRRLKRFQDDSGALCDRYLLLERVAAGLAGEICRRAIGPACRGGGRDAWAMLAAALGRDIARRHRALQRDYATEEAQWLRPVRRLAGQWAKSGGAARVQRGNGDADS